jgi:ribonuclease P protein component
VLNTHDFKLPKQEILKKSHIETVLQYGKRWEGHIIKCYYLKADERKVGFIVPKRLGKAVLRNRLKRVQREVYRHYRKRLGTYWILLMAKQTVPSFNRNDLEIDFHQFIKQTGLSL